jgi:hypothetical protein
MLSLKVFLESRTAKGGDDFVKSDDVYYLLKMMLKYKPASRPMALQLLDAPIFQALFQGHFNTERPAIRDPYAYYAAEQEKVLQPMLWPLGHVRVHQGRKIGHNPILSLQDPRGHAMDRRLAVLAASGEFNTASVESPEPRRKRAHRE